MAKTGQNREKASRKAIGANAHVRGSNPFYESSKENESGRELTTKQISYMFDVTTMTVFNWRNSKSLPFHHLEGGEKPPVRYNEGAVLHWSESQGIPVVKTDY